MGCQAERRFSEYNPCLTCLCGNLKRWAGFGNGLASVCPTAEGPKYRVEWKAVCNKCIWKVKAQIESIQTYIQSEYIHNVKSKLTFLFP